MDAKRLQEIEARANAATPGPWVRDGLYVRNNPHEVALARALDDEGHNCGEAYARPNGDFIAAARTDVSDLVAEVRRLTAALATARREGAEEMRERCDDALDRLERYYRATERDVKAHAVERGAAWERGAAIENARDTIRALPLDAPGGAT